MRGGAADGCADEVVMADGKGASAGAQMAIETPDSALWRLGRVAVVGGLAVSLVIHLALVGTAVLVSARFSHPSPVQAVTVDLVTSDDLAAAGPPKPDQPAPSKAPEPETQAQPPAPAPFAPPPSAPPPPSASAPPPSAPPPSAPPPSVPPSADTYAPSAAPPRPPPPPAPPRGQAAELAQLLGLPTPSADFAGGGTSEYQANLTADEIAAFATHVQGCWSAPATLAGAPKLNVVIRVSLRPDGSLAAEPALLSAPASAQGPALVQSAMRALMKCRPYGGLPRAKYDEWRLLDLHFSPSGISTAAPVPSAQRTPG